MKEEETKEVLTPEVNTKLEITQENAQKVVTMLNSGYTYEQIASKLGVSRNTLHGWMVRSDVRPLLIAEVTSLETVLQDSINTLLNSQSIVDRRFATAELAKMVRHSKDKIYPTLFIKGEVSATQQQNEDTSTQFKQWMWILTETLNRHNPEWKKDFWNTWIQVKQDWNIPPDTPITQHTQPPRHDYDKEKILNE